MSDSAAPPQDGTSPASTGETPQIGRPTGRWTIRLLAALVGILWIVPAVLGWLAPDSLGQFFFGRLILPNVCVLILLIIWMCCRQFTLSQRWMVLAAFVGTVVGTRVLLHSSMNEMSLMMYGAPAFVTVWSLWLIVTAGLSSSARSVGVVALNLAVGGVFGLLRAHGVTGSFAAEFDWRWNPSPEERLIASRGENSASELSAASESTEVLTLQPGDWPEFRGAGRTSVIRGTSIDPNWSQTPPKEIWREPVGPGWSSFCLVADHLYTQEQLGSDELVVCRNASTGKMIWSHAEKARFEEPVAGAGPRGTPTFADGWLYCQGARGSVLCLNATTGKVRWIRDIAKDTGAAIPEWGFSSSPLIHNGQVIVFAGAPEKSLISLNAETGDVVWTGGKGTKSYCSAQISDVGGLPQVLFCTDFGLTGFNPLDGKILWEHEWKTEGIARVVQPCVLSNGDILIGTGLGVGLRRVQVRQKDGQWAVQEVWTTNRCKPYFNDFVIHDNHLYGIDGAIFLCVNLDKGEIVWRTRGYGSGQVMLLADQGLLVIVTETGDLALVKATPEKHQELSRIRAVEGKTWNHPILAHNRLYVRNGAEAVCFEVRPSSEVVGGSADSAGLDPRL